MGAVMGALLSAPITHAVTVGPVRLEYSLNPGDTVSGTIMLMNEEKDPHTFYPSFERFTENNGAKVFIKETSDLSTWFHTASSVALRPGEQKNIPFTIDVPKDAQPGGHFAVMWWSTSPPDAKTGEQVSIVTRAGILVYMTVSGDIREGGSLTSLTANGGGSFFFGFPITFSAAFHNDGNVYAKPQGTVDVYNTFGFRSASFSVNEFGSNVLPQSDKSFDVVWQSNPWAFGVYHAVATLRFGSNSQTVTASKWFILLPLWNTIILVIVLVLIIWVLPWGIKRYNRWIIGRSSHS